MKDYNVWENYAPVEWMLDRMFNMEFIEDQKDSEMSTDYVTALMIHVVRYGFGVIAL